MAPLLFRRGHAGPGPSSVPAHRLGHVYLDVPRRLLHCLNDQARQLQGEGVPFTPADLTRQPLHTLAGEPVTGRELPMMVSWHHARSVESTFVLNRDSGIFQYIVWSAAPLRNSSNQVVGVVGSVGCMAPEPDWQTLAGLAHDLRTPLQSLKMLVAVLDEHPSTDASLRQIAERIRSTADRAMLIGLDLLEWCRAPVQRGRPIQHAWFPLEPLLRNLAAEQAVAARSKGLTLVGNLEATRGWDIHSERVRLGRLLANLLANAVRYTPTGRVEFTASWRKDPDGEYLVLAIIDSGAGISVEDQESIWQPFARGRAGREGDSSGSGVGLSVVDRLVEELGLTLEVYSDSNGSAFHLLLPENLLRNRSGG
jgi:hypothetical protein